MIANQRIYKYNLQQLEQKIETLNRKAVRLGCEPMNLSAGDDIVVKSMTEAGFEKIDVFVDVELDYEIPIVNGWKLVACFDLIESALSESVVFVSKVPGETIPGAYQNKTSIGCDHCGVNRFRKKSYLLKKIDSQYESGEYIEVGSTCVRDFFGHDPKGFLWLASLKFDSITGQIDEERWSHGNFPYYHSLKSVLIMTDAVMKKHGWVSRSKAYQEGGASTSDYVGTQLYSRHLAPEDKINVENVSINCWKLAKLGFVPDKMFGTACSMVSSYRRALLRADQQRERESSEFIGEIGNRMKFNIECVYCREIDGRFGISIMYVFKDGYGNIMKTFYSGSSWSMEIGDKAKIKGTIKKHDTYQNVKSTILNRVTIQ